MMVVEVRGGLTIPALGFGTWMLKERACRDAVGRALDIGYRHIDTAAAYRNETEVGAARARADRLQPGRVPPVSRPAAHPRPGACRRRRGRRIFTDRPRPGAARAGARGHRRPLRKDPRAGGAALARAAAERLRGAEG